MPAGIRTRPPSEGGAAHGAVVETTAQIDYLVKVDVHSVATQHRHRGGAVGGGREEAFVKCRQVGGWAGGHAGFVVAEHGGEGRYSLRHGRGVVSRIEHRHEAWRGQVGQRGIAHRRTIVAIAQLVILARVDVALHGGRAFHYAIGVVHQGRAGCVRKQRQRLAVSIKIDIGQA